MKRNGFDDAMIYAFLVSSLLILVALEGVFIWLLLSPRKIAKETAVTKSLNEKADRELYAAPARELVEPVPSAIEQTTNLLEPVYRDEKFK